MPRLPRRYADSDSRTASVGVKKPSASFHYSLPELTKCPEESPETVGETRYKEFIRPADSFLTTETSSQSSAGSLSFPPQIDDMSSTSNPTLGVNRLRSGFATPRATGHTDSSTDTTPNLNSSHPELTAASGVYDLTTDDDGGVTLNINGEASDPIVISDDENDRSERFGDDLSELDVPIMEGIEALSARPSQKEADNSEANSSQHSARRRQMSPTNSGDMVMDSIMQDSARSPADGSTFVIDSKPAASSHICLKDLSPDQLEDQIRYAFWYLDRHQIDLNRLSRCLNCQEDGHIDEICPQKACQHCGIVTDHDSRLCPKARRCERCREPGHDKLICKGMKNTTLPCDICSLPGHQETACPLKHFPRVNSSSRIVKLWISCCVCASRTHLVGDCPEVHAEKAIRWSLRSLDPSQITNLSVQASIQKMEYEAENRNLRPTGMKIKGRANIHYADANRRDQSDSDDQDFFTYPPAGRGARGTEYRSRPDLRDGRRDNFCPHGRVDEYRPPRNDFYATNSFGQARSRSPGPFRHRDDRSRRSPSFDNCSADSSYRFNNRGRDTYRRAASASQQRNTVQGHSNGGIMVHLPSRKGPGTSAQESAPKAKANIPTKQPQKSLADRMTTDKESASRKPRKKQKKRG